MGNRVKRRGVGGGSHPRGPATYKGWGAEACTFQPPSPATTDLWTAALGLPAPLGSFRRAVWKRTGVPGRGRGLQAAPSATPLPPLTTDS